MENMNGISASLDVARRGMGGFARTFSLTVPKESTRQPLAKGVPLTALRQGNACSLTEVGTVTPFDAGLPFAGFVQTLHQDREILVLLDKRGAVLIRIPGLTGETKMGSSVFATGENSFGLDSGALVGEVLGIEDLTRSTALVGFRRLDDVRPFQISGSVMERSR